MPTYKSSFALQAEQQYMFNLLSTERTLSPPLKTDEYPVDNFKDINIAEGETSQTEQYKFLFEKKLRSV